MKPSALPAAGPVPTVTVWAKTPAGATLAHPSHGRAPRDRPKGLSVPADTFTTRRLQDGDWTDTAPAAAPAARPATPKTETTPADPAA